MKHYLIAGAAASICCAVGAQEPDFKFTGFGTVGAVITNTDEAQFRASQGQSKGADKSGDFGVDSRLGLQADVKFSDMFSAVSQILESRHEGSDRPKVEWLYAKATVAPGLDFRAGRMVLPAFLISDSRAVGYSSYWVRAPRDVYDWYPPTSFDGGQALYRFAVADFNVQLQGSLGKAKFKIFENGLPTSLDLNFSKLSSLSATVDSGNWTMRIGQTLSRNVSGTLGGMRVYSNIRDAFTEAGLQYDNGTLVALTEFVARRQSSAGPLNSNSYYVSAGYRLGVWTPFASYSHYMPKGGGGMPGGSDSTTKSLGLRWDAFKNVALKAQVDHSLSPSENINESPAFAAHPKPINALSVVADFVF